MSILIVDDDPTLRELSTLLLTQAGFHDVTAVDSPAAAFRLLGMEPASDAAQMPDVILMDIMMPGIDGIEACARIKLDPRFADVPVLMVTTLDDVEHLKKAFIAGASDYMNKPIRAEELLARVRSAQRLKRELDRRKAREAELRALATSAPSAAGEPAPIAGEFPGEAALLSLLGAALSTPSPGGVLMVLGLDAWGAYEARCGSEKAMAALRQVRECLRCSPALLGDTIAALHHHRFALFYPRMPKNAAAQQADDLRARIAALNIPHPFSPVGATLSASIGSVSLGGWKHSAADVLAKALATQHAAEAAGGNRALHVATGGA